MARQHPPAVTSTRRCAKSSPAMTAFGEVEVRAWDWDQTYTAEDYRKLMLSYSGTQMMAPDDQRGLLDAIESFINQHFGGRITPPLVATITTARRA